MSKMRLDFLHSAVLAKMSAARPAAGAKVHTRTASLIGDLLQRRFENVSAVIVEPDHAAVGIWEDELAIGSRLAEFAPFG